MNSLEGKTVEIVGDLWSAINLDHIMGIGFLPGSIVEVVKDTEEEVIFRPQDTSVLPGDWERVVISEHAMRRSEFDSARELFRDNISVID